MIWREVPIRSVYRRVEERGREDLPLLSVYRDHGVVPREERDDNNNRPSEDLSNYKHVRPGDLVVNKMKTWQGSLAVSSYEGIVSPAYFVGRRVAAVDDRFMHHLLRSMPLIAEYGARSKGIRPAQWDLPWDEFASIKISLPSTTTQHAIADYLDTETARIDALITKKQRMIELLEEQLWVRFKELVALSNSVEVPLRRLLVRITDGPFGSSLTSAHYVDHGARVVRLGNIRLGEFDNSDAAFIDMAHYSNLTRHQVRAGDLLIAGLGDSSNHVGRACVAPDLGPAIVKADCYCAVVNHLRASTEYVALFLSSGLGKERVAMAARGTTRSRINLDIAKEIRVSLPELSDQVGIVERFRAARKESTAMQLTLVRQVELLQELRQALISAAVTGQLEIPGVVA